MVVVAEVGSTVVCNCDAVLEVMRVLIVEEIDFAVVIVVSSKHEILSELRTYPTVHPQLDTPGPV